MEQAKISNLYDLEQTIAKDLFEGATYPWERIYPGARTKA